MSFTAIIVTNKSNQDMLKSVVSTRLQIVANVIESICDNICLLCFKLIKSP